MSKILNILSKIFVGLIALFAVLFSSCSFFRFKTSCDTLNLPVYRNSGGDVTLDSDSGITEIEGEIKIVDDSGWGKKYVSIKIPQNLNDSVSYTLPSEQGKVDYVLTWQEGNLLQWKDINSVSLGGTGELIQVVEKKDTITTNTSQTGGSFTCTNLICAATSSIDLDSEVTGILSLKNGGIGTSLEDPGEDRILFWDESMGKARWLKIGDNLEIDDRALNADSDSDYPGGSEDPVEPPVSYTGEIYTAGNGLYVSGSEVKLGGALTEYTTLSLGVYDMVYDLNGTGDFNVKNDEVSAFFINDSGYVGIGNTNPLYALDISYHSNLFSWDISEPTYQGDEGLNDMSVGGVFTGSEETTYQVYIDSSSTPDTFAWNDGVTWEYEVPITGGTQPLSNGVYVSFSNTTGHKVSYKRDKWQFFVTIVPSSNENLFGVRDWFGEYAFHIDTNGNVGIGTTDPQEQLTLAGGNFYHYASGNPTLAGSYDEGEVSSVYVSGNLAYIDSYDGGLEIVDISNPSSPLLVGTHPDYRGKIVVSGKYAYFSNYSDGFNIVDISNPASPVLVGTYPGSIRSVDISGKYAYITDGDFKIIDISNLSSPSLIGTYSPYSIQNAQISGNYAYAVYQYTDFGLLIIDISDPTNPKQTAILSVTDNFDRLLDIKVSGDYVYLVSEDDGLVIVDVSDPYDPDSVGSTSDMDVFGRYYKSVYISGNYAYLASSLGEEGGSTLNVIDISDKTNPTEVGYYFADDEFIGFGSDIFLSGKYAYLAAGGSGLLIIDINGMETPAINTGDIFASNLHISDDIVVGDNLNVQNSINMGPGGFYSQGPSSIMLGAGITAPHTAFTVTQLGTGDIVNLIGTNGEVLTVTGSGSLGIGTTDPTANLHVAGTLRFSNFGAGTLTTDASGNVSVSSDEKLKEIQGKFDKGLEEIIQLDPILYKWKDSSGMETETTYAGLSAQNVQSVIPEAVGVDPNGYLTLSDRPIIAATINAIKEQQKQIDDLRDMLKDGEVILESSQPNDLINIPTTDTGILSEIQTLFEEFKEMLLTLGMTSHTNIDGTGYLSIDSDVKMAGDLSVLGEITTSDLTLTGNVQMGLITINTEENSIDVLGVSCYNEETGEESEYCTDTIDDSTLSTLYLQKSSTGNLDIFNGKLVIEPNGNMKLEGNLEVTGRVNSKSVDTETFSAEKIILKNTTVEKPEESEITSEDIPSEPRVEESVDLTEPCEKGEIKWDDNNIYVCTSSEKWKVSPLSDIE